MRMDRNLGSIGPAGGRLAGLAICALLADCGGGGKRNPAELILGDQLSTETVAFADGAGLRLPRHLDGFDRTGLTAAPKASGVTASYQAGSTTVTVRVRRAGGGRTLFSSPDSIATTARSSAALAREVASLRLSEPDLTETVSTDLYLVRFGAIQAGRTARFSGGATPVTVDAFCCINGIWSYTFEIRGSGGEDGARFVRDLAWSASEDASVEEPR